MVAVAEAIYEGAVIQIYKRPGSDPRTGTTQDDFVVTVNNETVPAWMIKSKGRNFPGFIPCVKQLIDNGLWTPHAASGKAQRSCSTQSKYVPFSHTSSRVDP